MTNDNQNKQQPQLFNPIPSNSQNLKNEMMVQNLQEMFPNLYDKIKPHIDEIAKELGNEGISADVIDSIIQEIMNSSGLPQENQEETMVPTFHDLGPGYLHPYPYPNPYYNYGRYPRPPYQNFSLKKLIKIMLLQQLGKYYL